MVICWRWIPGRGAVMDIQMVKNKTARMEALEGGMAPRVMGRRRR